MKTLITDREQKMLFEAFLSEAQENLDTMDASLVAIENAPNDSELLATVFRNAHTLKGNAAAFRLESLTQGAHHFEDVLQQIREGELAVDASLITVLLQGVDSLRGLLRAETIGGGRMRRADEKMIRNLESLASTVSTNNARATERDQSRAGMATRSNGALLSEGQMHDRTLRVGIEKLDRLLDLSGEMAIARGRLRQTLESGHSPELRRAIEVHKEADRLYADLQELVMEVRMVPAGPMFRQYSRVVRDQAAAIGKQLRLVLDGEDTEVDTKIVEYLRDPVTHLIRNAIDHGIEKPGVRAALGKDPCGTIRLSARHETGSIVFEVTDDGAGLDKDRILDRARSRGLVSSDEQLTESQVADLIFEPGFSTSEETTSLSGRGVGLDVVRRNVNRLRGTLTVHSEPRSGTSFLITVPLSLAIISGFSVGVGNETFVVPLESVIETLELSDERDCTDREHTHGIANVRGTPLPYVRLRSLFESGKGAPAREHVLVVRHGEDRAGLVVDVLHGESQTVVKPLGRLLQRVSGISGSAILGSGRVALILDVPALLREATDSGHPRAQQ